MVVTHHATSDDVYRLAKSHNTSTFTIFERACNIKGNGGEGFIEDYVHFHQHDYLPEYVKEYVKEVLDREHSNRNGKQGGKASI